MISEQYFTVNSGLSFVLTAYCYTVTLPFVAGLDRGTQGRKANGIANNTGGANTAT